MPDSQLKVVNGDGLFGSSSASGSEDVISQLFKPKILTMEGRNFENAFEDSAGNQSEQFWNLKDVEFQKYPPITPKNKVYTIAPGASKTIRTAIEPLGEQCKEIIEGNLRANIIKEAQRELVLNESSPSNMKMAIAQDPATEIYAIIYRKASGELYIRQAAIDATTGVVTLQAETHLSGFAVTDQRYNDLDIQWFAASSRFVAVFSNASNQGQVKNFAINGTGFTVGGTYPIYSTNIAGRFKMLVADSTGQDGVIAWIRADSYSHVVGFRCNANTSVTVGTAVAGASSRQYVSIAKSADDVFLLGAYNSVNALFYRVTMSNYTVALGTNSLTNTIAKTSGDLIYNTETSSYYHIGHYANGDITYVPISTDAIPTFGTHGVIIPGETLQSAQANAAIRAVFKNNKIQILAKSTDGKIYAYTVDMDATSEACTVESKNLIAEGDSTSSFLDFFAGDSEFVALTCDKNGDMYVQPLHTTNDIIEVIGASYTETKTINGTAVTDFNDLSNVQINNTKLLFEWTVTNTDANLSLEIGLGASGVYGGEKTYDNSEVSLLF